MDSSPRRAIHGAPMLFSVLSSVGVVVLLAWDIHPKLFPANSHALLGAFPLATIGFAWLAQQATERRSFQNWLKAILLAAAFFFWAANQCLPNPQAATVCNDIAIALFILDLVWVIAGQKP